MNNRTRPQPWPVSMLPAPAVLIPPSLFPFWGDVSPPIPTPKAALCPRYRALGGNRRGQALRTALGRLSDGSGRGH
jgi:hypothetical protein